VRRRALAPISDLRREESALYQLRRRTFLLRHPYCQVWLAEHGLAEAGVVRDGGRARLGSDWVAAPLSTEIHHRNKRRGEDLLDQRHWLAVSREAHRRIESDKAWARARGYLLDF
jgi:hypothetical protein